MKTMQAKDERANLDKGHDGQPHLKGEMRQESKVMSIRLILNAAQMGLHENMIDLNPYVRRKQEQTDTLFSIILSIINRGVVEMMYSQTNNVDVTLTRHTDARHALNSGPYR